MPTKDAHVALFKAIEEQHKKIEQTYDMRGCQYFFVAKQDLLGGK